MLLVFLAATAFAVSFDSVVADPLGVVLADPHTPEDFRVVVFSFAAEVCAGRVRTGQMSVPQGQACLDQLVAATTDPRVTPWRRPTAGVEDFGENALYLTHLAIVLGERDLVSPESCDHTLHARVVEHLVARSLADPSGVARSTADSGGRWPADQAATLFALHLYDQAHHTGVLAGPRARYLTLIGGSGLPRSELTGLDTNSEHPRGSALMFTVRYLQPYASAEARSLWERAVTAGFLDEVGPVVGVREWAPGLDGPQDDDSGPIVSGLGAAATALGRIAAQEVGDDRTARALGRTAGIGRMLASKGFPGLPGTANSALAAVITARAELWEQRSP